MGEIMKAIDIILIGICAMIVIIMLLLLQQIMIGESDTEYLLKSVQETCPGVPEITWWNSPFSSETTVRSEWNNRDVDWHKTVEKMRIKCKDLQVAKGVNISG